ACDAQYTRVVIGPDGQIVATGSERRFFTAAQRRAMIARDGDRCATPYCDRPVLWSDGHHLVPVEDGGPTTIANGALPCAGHHQLLHEGHWQLDRLPDGRYTLTHPDGRTIGPEPHPPGHNRPPPTRRRE
ncbi:MAG TPA: HNH endonuclease signature motif containing protein, partial [Actinomycetes bacterium]